MRNVFSLWAKSGEPVRKSWFQISDVLVLEKVTVMNVRHICLLSSVTALTILIEAFGIGKAIAVPQSPADGQAGVQVLTRGPVHEAFAETVTFDPEPGIVVPKSPPAAIEELPPDQKPEGANVAWIPGYWAWDDERNDFLWVSGIWRDLPPGRQWVPGYWGQSEKGCSVDFRVLGRCQSERN